MDYERIAKEKQKTKVCFKCKKTKSLNEFYRHSEMADGYLNKCKECNKKDVAKNYQKNREYYAEYERKRFQDPKRKKLSLEYQRKRRTKSPDQYKAHSLTGNAVRDGRLIQGVCVICGDPKTEAHHEDYSKPLDVIWLCREHHLEVHGKQAYKFEETETAGALI